MSRADDIAARIRKAGAHPQAPLLFAIGAASPSPTSAAQTAHALGAPNDAEKLAKWVAVLKRDAETLYGRNFEDALCEILKGDHPMKVTKGSGYYKAQFEKICDSILEWHLTNLGTIYGGIQFQDHRIEVESVSNGAYLFTDSGVTADLFLRAKSKEGMPIARRIGRRLEAMTRRKGFQEVPTHVTIVQDF